jgi:uncharacterized protein (TIGR00251 family)
MNIFVKVKPKARQEKIEKIDETHYVVHTKNIPEKGRANEGVIDLLAQYFSISKSNIIITSGKTSRMKVVVINI